MPWARLCLGVDLFRERFEFFDCGVVLALDERGESIVKVCPRHRHERGGKQEANEQSGQLVASTHSIRIVRWVTHSPLLAIGVFGLFCGRVRGLVNPRSYAPLRWGFLYSRPIQTR